MKSVAPNHLSIAEEDVQISKGENLSDHIVLISQRMVIKIYRSNTGLTRL